MAEQVPIGSGFGAGTTAAEVVDGVDLDGTTAIVTGGHSRIGVETVRALRGAGATVIVPTRSRERAAVALAGIDGVEVEPMDLMDPASIDAFAAGVVASGRAVRILVNNAAVMMVPLARDARGFESQLATNHLGHFQLTLGLWPALVRADGARVVNVSSWGHRHSSIIWDDPHFDRHDYDPLASYGQSKTANNLHAVAIDQRGHADGIRGFALHPGSIVGVVTDPGEVEMLHAVGLVDEHGAAVIDPARNMKTPAQGAATSVWCAASPQLDGLGGLYCENCDVAPLVEMPDDPDAAARFDAKIKGFGSTPLGVMPYSVDADAAARLWELSLDLIGVPR